MHGIFLCGLICLSKEGNYVENNDNNKKDTPLIINSSTEKEVEEAKNNMDIAVLMLLD